MWGRVHSPRKPGASLYHDKHHHSLFGWVMLSPSTGQTSQFPSTFIDLVFSYHILLPFFFPLFLIFLLFLPLSLKLSFRTYVWFCYHGYALISIKIQLLPFTFWWVSYYPKFNALKCSNNELVHFTTTLLQLLRFLRTVSFSSSMLKVSPNTRWNVSKLNFIKRDFTVLIKSSFGSVVLLHRSNSCFFLSSSSSSSSPSS